MTTPATPNPLRVGVIGQGFVGRAHSLALQHARRVAGAALEPVVLCGRDGEQARANAALWGYERATADWRAVVEAPDVELVCVLAPNAMHRELVLAALAAGKQVLCEKPLATTLADSDELCRAAPAAPCSFNYRFVPAVELARQLIAAGVLGRIHHYRARYLQDWGNTAARRWHHDAAQAGSGAIGDYCHVIDLAHHLVGDIARVSAETFVARAERADAAGTMGPVTAADAYVAAGTFVGGATLTLECSRVAAGHKAQQRVEVEGEQGALWWDMEDLNVLHLQQASDGTRGGFRRILVTEPEHPFISHWWPSGHTLGWEHTFVHQWIGLAAAHAAGAAPAPPQATFTDGWRADVVVHALVDAAAAQRTAVIDYGARPGGPSSTTRQEQTHAIR